MPLLPNPGGGERRDVWLPYECADEEYPAHGNNRRFDIAQQGACSLCQTKANNLACSNSTVVSIAGTACPGLLGSLGYK